MARKKIATKQTEIAKELDSSNAFKPLCELFKRTLCLHYDKARVGDL